MKCLEMIGVGLEATPEARTWGGRDARVIRRQGVAAESRVWCRSDD